MGTIKTIQATEERKLVSVTVEDGEIICKGRSVIDVAGRKIRGPVEETTISKWPFEIDGVKYNRKKILELLQAIYEAEIG